MDVEEVNTSDYFKSNPIYVLTGVGVASVAVTYAQSYYLGFGIFFCLLLLAFTFGLAHGLGLYSYSASYTVLSNCRVLQAVVLLLYLCGLSFLLIDVNVPYTTIGHVLEALSFLLGYRWLGVRRHNERALFGSGPQAFLGTLTLYFSNMSLGYHIFQFIAKAIVLMCDVYVVTLIDKNR